MDLTILFIIGIILLHDTKASSREKEQTILNELLSSGKYDTQVRPRGHNVTGPVLVKTNIYIRRVHGPDEVNNDVDMQLTFRQEWKDDRLRYNSMSGTIKYLTVRDAERIWIPDTFFSNEISGHFHNIIQPNVLLRVAPDGGVLYSIRISLKLSCLMNLKYYPFDEQICDIMVATYGYTTEDIVFQWKEVTPIQFKRTFTTLMYTLTTHATESCTSETNTGEYTCLKAKLTFRRNIYSYIVQVFLPFTFFILLSWIPFWLDPRSTTLRIGLWCAVFLAMVLTSLYVHEKQPITGYLKSLDVWTGMCFTFLLCTIVELVFVAGYAKDSDGLGTDINNCMKDAMTDDPAESGSTVASRMRRLKNWLYRSKSKAEKIDVTCRLMFPIIYILFNAIFFLAHVRKG